MKNLLKYIIIVFYLITTTNTVFSRSKYMPISYDAFQTTDINAASFMDFCYENGINIEFNGISLLHIAVEDQRIDRVLKLLEHSTNIDVRARHTDKRVKITGYTPLGFAVVYLNLEIIDALIKAGANANTYLFEKGSALSTVDFYKHNDLRNPTLLEIAIQDAENNSLETVKRLLNAGADPNMFSGNLGPLVKAIVLNNPEIVELLIAAGADLEHSTNMDIQTKIYSATPLGYAVKTQNPKIVDILIKAGANTNALIFESNESSLSKLSTLGSAFDPDKHKNFLKLTLLDQAVECGNLEIIKTLLDADANDNTSTDGETPLAKAIKRIYPEKVKLLLKQAIDTKNQEIIDLLAAGATKD